MRCLCHFEEECPRTVGAFTPGPATKSVVDVQNKMTLIELEEVPEEHSKAHREFEATLAQIELSTLQVCGIPPEMLAGYKESTSQYQKDIEVIRGLVKKGIAPFIPLRYIFEDEK